MSSSLFVFISKPASKQANQTPASTHAYSFCLFSSFHVIFFISPSLSKTPISPYTTIHRPHISGLRKQHSMFLSFPWPLVPEPFEQGSIPNINVCCSLITAPLVGDEADNQTVKLPSFLFASFPLSYLTLLFSIFIFLCDRSDT